LLSENKMSKWLKEYRITDFFLKLLAVAIPDSKVLPNSWMRYAEVEYWMQWYREMEGVIGIQEVLKQFLVNGRPVRMGPWNPRAIGRFSRT
jgi:hypothetical protein